TGLTTKTPRTQRNHKGDQPLERRRPVCIPWPGASRPGKQPSHQGVLPIPGTPIPNPFPLCSFVAQEEGARKVPKKKKGNASQGAVSIPGEEKARRSRRRLYWPSSLLWRLSLVTIPTPCP